MKWLWLIIAAILLILLLWWVLKDDEAEVAGGIAPAASVEAGMAPGPAPAANLAAATASIPTILANPSAFVGRDDFAGEVGIPEVPTDRGFWVEQDGARMFALIIDGPREDPVDINSGQRLRVTEGMLRDGSALDQIPGQPLNADTRRILADQPIFLVVHEDNIEILSRGGA